MNQTADVVIVGGGVIGCSILYSLASQGITKVLLLEKNTLGSGSTGRSQAILRMHYSNEVTTRMAWESLTVFRNFEEIVGYPSGYVETGYLLIVGSADQSAMIQNVVMQKKLGVETDILSHDNLKEVTPQFVVSPEEFCAFEPRSGYADPSAVVHGYAKKATDLGATVKTNDPVTDIKVSQGKIKQVTTSQNKIETPNVILAAGPWSNLSLASLGIKLPLQTVRHQVIAFRRPLQLSNEHVTIGDVPNSLSARPEAGHLTLVGVGEHELSEIEGYSRGIKDQLLEDVKTKIASRIPGMSKSKFRGGWSGLFTTTPDWHPILDKVEGIDGLFCAVGFSGHGFKLAPMVGIAMAELVLKEKAETIDISMLNIDRFKTGQTLRSRYQMNVLA